MSDLIPRPWDPEVWMITTEAAQYVGFSRDWITKLCADGVLKCARAEAADNRSLLGPWLVSREDIKAYRKEGLKRRWRPQAPADVEEADGRFECEWCGRRLETEEGLAKHIEVMHPRLAEGSSPFGEGRALKRGRILEYKLH